MRVAASLLGSGRVAAQAGHAAAVVAGVASTTGRLSVPAAAGLATSLALWVAHCWAALRVSLDARLLTVLEPDDQALGQFDALLEHWHLRSRGEVRGAEDRCRAAVGLWRRQLLLCALQIVALLVGLGASLATTAGTR